MNNRVPLTVQQIIPVGMDQTHQFITYNLVPDPKFPGKFLKKPVDARGWDTSALNRVNWMSPADAIAQALALGGSAGVGFVFTELDRFWFIDLDGAVGPNGELSQLAYALIKLFAGCAIEVSQSGTGLHLFGTADDIPAHRKKIALPSGETIEFYTEGRFVALTGDRLCGNAALDFTKQIGEFVTTYGLEPDPANSTPTEYVEGVVAGCNPYDTDGELIQRMQDSVGSAAASFGKKCHPRDLWQLNMPMIERSYPPMKPTDTFDWSGADLGIMSHLAFYTGNAARAVRLFEQWRMYRKDKYEGRPDLLARLVRKAFSGQKTWHDRNYRSTPPQPAPGVPGLPAIAAASWKLEQTGSASANTISRDFQDSHHLNGIMAMDLPDPKYLVDDLITPGLFLLIGKPKKGKSWMMMELALNVAIGGNFLGKQCRQGKVIYFALEDNRRRIKKRMELMMPASFTMGTTDLHILTMEDKVENMDRGFVGSLRHTLERTAGHALVIVDTLSIVRFAKRGNEALYDYDRRSIDPLTQLCAEFPNLTILVVHHARKNDSEDPYDLASGTLGLTGAADGTFVLAYDTKNQTMVFHGTGRDIEPVELAVKLTPPRWQVLGDPDDVGMSETRRKIIEHMEAVKIPQTLTEIATGVNMLPPSRIQGPISTMLKTGKLSKQDKLYNLAR